MEQVISRSEAKQKGSLYYFTGKPCKYGHVSTRLVSTGNCRDCMAEKSYQRKAWYEENKERVSELCRKYREENAKSVFEAKKSYRERNFEKVSLQKKRWYETNKIHVLARCKKYRQENKEKQAECGKRKNERKKHRRAVDPVFALKSRISGLIRSSIRNRGLVKSKKTAKILGCEIHEFKCYIESRFQDGMSWENMSLWHIDHIIPMASAKTVEDVESLNHFTNLRPLWASENLSKGSKMYSSPVEFYGARLGCA